MSESAQNTSGDRAKCDGPIENFIVFAKGMTAKSAATRLQRLASGPDASRFAERLVEEASSGSAHAVTCMGLIGRFGGEPGWRKRLKAVTSPGAASLPSDGLPTTQLASVANGLLLIAPGQALSWIARACLRLKDASATRTALQTLLAEAAPSSFALTGAMADAVGWLEAAGQKVTRGTAARCAEILQQHALRYASSGEAAKPSPLARLAGVADRADMARVVAALVLAQSRHAPAPRANGATPKDQVEKTKGGGSEAGEVSSGPSHGDAKSPEESAGGGTIEQAIAQAAWSEADEALGRALQDMDFLDRSFKKLESAAEGDLAERARKAKDASELVLQWVRQAAHHRNVAALNKVGDRVPFDPAKLDGDAQIGELVKVVKQPVVRGSEPRQVVLVRGEAEVE
jgi:hypothetical protein